MIEAHGLLPCPIGATKLENNINIGTHGKEGWLLFNN
jgi:hypothetical protein